MYKYKNKTVLFFSIVIVSAFLLVLTNTSRAKDDNEYEEYDYSSWLQEYEADDDDDDDDDDDAARPSPVNQASVSLNNPVVLSVPVDSDQDGVIDVFDKHTGEDDFAYSLVDNNQNGIADDLEALIR